MTGNSTTHSFQEANILLFGGHILTQTKQTLEGLVESLREGPNADWITQAIASLPTYWDALTTKIPEVAAAVPGRRLLAELDSWLQNGVDSGGPPPDENLPNTVVGPLLVAIQLNQYWRYLELQRHSKGLPHDDDSIDLQAELVGKNEVEVLGFCAGLLAGVAVAGSSNRQEFEQYGAASMRIAMLIGAVIDAREEWDKGLGKGGSVSYVTAWRGAQQHEDMKRIVESVYPDAYISVFLDESRATITTSERTAPGLMRKLRAARLTVAEVGIRGYIHTPGVERKRHTEILTEMCREMPGLQLGDAASLALPTYDNQGDNKPLSPDRGDLADMVLRSVMMLPCNWYGTFSKVMAKKKNDDDVIVAFGLDRCIPPTMLRSLGSRQQHFEDLEKHHPLARQQREAREQEQKQKQSQAAAIQPQGASITNGNGLSSTLGSPPSFPSHAAGGSTTTTPTPTSTVLTNGKDTSTTPPLGFWNSDSIAVVGMSIKVAGADDLEEFESMLKTGESQHELITRDKLEHDYLFREPIDADPKRKFYANFVRDADAFDHKFFKRSPRESQAIDPQSRLCLEGAYEAVEQSGYFAEPLTPSATAGRDKRHVGVYLGNCGVDYEHNITCHQPSAFTATGGLRSFIVGRLSHYFGWTGPALTFDTACSSSAVAVHTACRNLLEGECTAALCGGVNIITNMLWMQNLSAASFVSHTGQCKPFDDDADGYCRAEGMAFVFLKKLSDAVADGNPVLATIPATAVYQNLNCTPLFVPNSPSLSLLFRDVMRKAGVAPRDISLVEAHGTGTPVGDPAEYESVRIALGGPIRDKPLPLGSVKGHIGHTEGASGLIALVKVIVMMRGGFIPPQASFKKLNHQIQVRPDDMMEIVTSLRSWAVPRKLALLNNYGACGSNASMLISEPPPLSYLTDMARGSKERRWKSGAATEVPTTSGHRFPFWMAGLDVRSIASYSAKVSTWLQQQRNQRENITLADMSFTMARQSNRALPQGLVFTCGSITELSAKLQEASSSTKETAGTVGIALTKPERPVILCFGGQVSTFVGLDSHLYDSVAVLRRHLDECDAEITAAGLDSIFPDIFKREPVGDAVKLQTMLFALQYSCAKSWMDCGLETKVAAVVGHSFGEITALCVAGVLSLADTVKLVAGRARLVRDSWGPDPGAMMAVVDTEETTVQDFVGEVNRVSDSSVGIACYNGPRSFTLAGSTKAIDKAAELLTSGDSRFAGIKSKRLSVTNAFHSTLVDGLVDGLGELGKNLTFHEPVIPVERATETSSSDSGSMDWTFVPTHMRKPVFFNHALHRIAQRHPQAIFLEAGSSSTVTVMAMRALASKASDSYHFQSLSITSDGGFDALADATASLWKQGLRVSFWAHHPLQAQEYGQILLSPYQFDRSGRHWLHMRSPKEIVQKAAEELLATRGLEFGTATLRKAEKDDPKTLDLWTFIGYQDKDKTKRRARFRVNTASDKYNHFFAGHLIAQTAPICPATLESDMAIEAAFSLHPEWRDAGYSPVVRNLVNHSPICADSSRTVYIDLVALDGSETRWSVTMLSVKAGVEKDTDIQLHVEASLQFRSPTDPEYLQEFGRLERLVGHSRCQALLALASLDGHDNVTKDESDDIDVLRGRNVYRAFREVVDYPELYRGVKCVVGRGLESAGVVAKRHQGVTWLDVPLSDSLSQVGGMWVNLMTDTPSSDMYIATGCEASMRSPRVRTETDGKPNGPDLWHVFAQHSPKSEKEYTTDVFSFDAATGELMEAMLGIQYARVAKASMSKMLARLTADKSVLRTGHQNASTASAATPSPIAKSSNSDDTSTVRPRAADDHPRSINGSAKNKSNKKKTSKNGTGNKRRDITDDVRNLVANLAGIDPSELELDAEMADLGIDSLMGMELGREVEEVFKCTLDQAEQMEATSLRKFVACVANALEKAGLLGGDGNADLGDEEDDEEENHTSSSDEGDAWSKTGGGDATSGASTPVDELTQSSLEQKSTGPASTKEAPSGIAVSNLTLSRSDVLECFGQVKLRTDDCIREHHLDTVHKVMIAASNRLCVALVVEALEKLGMPLHTAAPGQVLDRVPFLPQHRRLMECVYEFLERDARLVDVDVVSGQLTRTHIATPRKSSQALLEELVVSHPGFAVPNRLTHYAGKSLAEVLSGKTDGIRVIFGTAEGRELVQAMYCEHTFNRMNYLQMGDVIQRLADRLRGRQPGETLKLLEMGAGTGGTTLVIAPLLASLAAQGLPVEYTFTDLSPSMVASARRRFGTQYPFMRFAVHDIEKPPAEDLRGQHIVLASNAIHATHDLVVSLRNVRQSLRPDGFVMILEMTEVVPFVDIVFGLLEGWWLFDDGRKHAVVPAEHWERELHTAGFGHVDWTDGNLPENAFQKVIMALASGPQEPNRLPKVPLSVESGSGNKGKPKFDRGDVAARETEAKMLVSKYTRGWATSAVENTDSAAGQRDASSGKSVVIVTGATGSLGAHLVQRFAEHAGVSIVVCINRPTSTPADKRQAEAFSSRGIDLSPGARAKLRVLETDTKESQLGLPPSEYAWLVEHGTHIVHNAWPMSGTRPLKAFEPQLQAFRNLLNLARDIATSSGRRVGFQFVSSIGVVGYSDEQRVLERRVPMAAVLPGGYTEAKWACERMLDETLHRYPQLFRAMVVRPGQIAGSTVSGYWNHVEHFAFLVKSAQSLRAWPDFDGVLQWLPVDTTARVVAELLKLSGNGETEEKQSSTTPESYPVYHIDNPVGQPWKAMSPVLAAALDIPPHNIMPFKAWIQRVRRSPLLADVDNPAARLVDFLEDHFERMSCGGLILDTQRAQEHSETMARAGLVPAEVARKYVESWKKVGFLHE